MSTKLNRFPDKYPISTIERIHKTYVNRANTGVVDPTKGRGHYNDAGETKDCAYVTLMMIGDAYLPGALVLAESIRNTNTIYPIIIMVTPDVSDNAKTILITKYDEIVNIDYITYDTIKLTGERHKRYGHWNHLGFTKFHMMNLVKYRKVLYLETDEQVLFNIDHLFKMPTPVGFFSSPWGYPNTTYVMNPYITLNEGDYVQPWMIEEALTNYGHGSIGSLVLLRPDSTLFQKFHAELKVNQPFGYKYAQSTIEEVVFPWFYSIVMNYPMYQSHLKYGWVPWKKIPDTPGWDKVYVNHFFGVDKPWKEHRSKYTDNYWNLWWDTYTKIYHSIDPIHQPYLNKLCPYLYRTPADVEMGKSQLDDIDDAKSNDV